MLEHLQVLAESGQVNLQDSLCKVLHDPGYLPDLPVDYLPWFEYDQCVFSRADQ